MTENEVEEAVKHLHSGKPLHVKAGENRFAIEHKTSAGLHGYKAIHPTGKKPKGTQRGHVIMDKSRIREWLTDLEHDKEASQHIEEDNSLRFEEENLQFAETMRNLHDVLAEHNWHTYNKQPPKGHDKYVRYNHGKHRGVIEVNRDGHKNDGYGGGHQWMHSDHTDLDPMEGSGLHTVDNKTGPTAKLLSPKQSLKTHLENLDAGKHPYSGHSQHTGEDESLRFEELVNQGPLVQFGTVQFANRMDLEPHKDIIGEFEHKPANPEHKGFKYRVGKAKYANNQLAVHMASGDGWKHKGHRLVDHLNGRYSHREGAYIMSPGKVKKLHSLINSGHDATMFGKLIPPDSQHSEQGSGEIESNEQDIEQLVHPSLRRE